VSDESNSRYELARQVVVNVGAGLVAGYAGPLAGAAAAGAAPIALAGMDFISATIGSRRMEHAAQTLTDAADAFGAKTPDEFIEFITAAVIDEEHQELLARALTIAQDTAMRSKRRALGRALAAAASDTGTKVDEELLFIRVLADLDEAHIRVLRITNTTQPRVVRTIRSTEDDIREEERRWHPKTIARADPGLASTVQELLLPLERHGLIWILADSRERHSQSVEDDWRRVRITSYGEWFLTRLAEPA
jgi:hypothetical protein